MNSLLPIGSIVKIKGIKKPIMIFGFLQKSGVSSVNVVDYVGVPYPEGNIGAYSQIGFQREDIEELIFEGYRSEDFQPYRDLFDKYGRIKENEKNENSLSFN